MAQQPRFFNVGQAAQPLPAGAAAYDTTSVGGNIPIGLSMPGTGGQYNQQQSLRLPVGSIPYFAPINQTAESPLLYNQQATSTSTNSNSSFWNQFLGSYPSELASTFGGLVKGAFSQEDFTPVGFTPRAAPTARGHFPYRLSGPIHLSVAQIQYRNRSQARICSHWKGRRLHTPESFRPEPWLPRRFLKSRIRCWR